jgi:hypothetical protein
MTEPLNRETTNPARPIGSVGDVVEDVAEGPDRAGDGRMDELPAHEIDEDETVGGGLMSQGGTAIDRGTGTTGGQAQGTPLPDEDPGVDRDDDPDEVVPNPATHA